MTTPDDVLQRRLPELPKDLGRLLFEHLASIGDTSSAFVSKEVQRWVEPIMYHEVVLNSPEEVKLFHRTVSTFNASRSVSNKPRDFLETRIKLLSVFANRLPLKIFRNIAQSCSSIRSFALYSESSETLVAPLTEWSKFSLMASPSHISMVLAGMRTLIFPNSFFKNVTHLELQSLWVGTVTWPETHLASVNAPAMPHLTHLSIGVTPFDHDDPPMVPIPAPDLTSTAREFSLLLPARLEVFILAINLKLGHGWAGFAEGIRAISRGDVDPRAVVVLTLAEALPEDLEGVDDWKDTVVCRAAFPERMDPWKRLDTVEKGYWRRAETIIAQRNGRMRTSGH